MYKKRRYIIIYTLVLASFLLSICFSTDNEKFIPVETFKNIVAFIKSIFGEAVDAKEIVKTLPYYFQTQARIRMSVITLLSGAGICFAGAIFQTSFKNPVASPNIIGVSTGITIGNIVFILVYGLQAIVAIRMRYVFCYVFTLAVVSLTIGAGQLFKIKNKEFSTDAMIIIGMIITHLGSVFTTYYSYQIEMDDTGLAEIYTNITSGNYLFADLTSTFTFLIMMLLTGIPMLLLRYKFNSVAFDDDEVVTMGISNVRIRWVGMFLGSLMAATAIIFGGEVGLLSMVIPFICRKKLHAEFGEVAFTSIGLGATLLLLARSLSCVMYHAYFDVPLGSIITIIVLPVFVISLVRREGVTA